ncbi:MAG: hypothetical protein CM15mV51_0600 [uncultured marine virus]|nr:MAG: hypothetical protein CM15mV51_0600 [uncultured marine virus]
MIQKQKLTFHDWHPELSLAVHHFLTTKTIDNIEDVNKSGGTIWRQL